MLTLRLCSINSTASGSIHVVCKGCENSVVEARQNSDGKGVLGLVCVHMLNQLNSLSLHPGGSERMVVGWIVQGNRLKAGGLSAPPTGPQLSNQQPG